MFGRRTLEYRCILQYFFKHFQKKWNLGLCLQLFSAKTLEMNFLMLLTNQFLLIDFAWVQTD